MLPVCSVMPYPAVPAEQIAGTCETLFAEANCVVATGRWSYDHRARAAVLFEPAASRSSGVCAHVAANSLSS